MASGTVEHRDSFFRNLLGLDKDANARFLDVMNAVFGTKLTLETAEIEDVSLDNVFYTKLRSDVAKVVNGTLVVLLEQQSTINENMPLRMLEYAAETYISMLEVRDRYKLRLQKIPRPLFVVFYNGKADFPTEKTLRLSDAFMEDSANGVMLELTVRVINININKTADILKKSSVLFDYSTLCGNIEECQRRGESDYVRAGILRTIDSGILADYLKRNITEAAGMMKAEYDYDMDMEVKAEERWQQGIQQGIALQKTENAKLLSQRDEEIARLKAQLAAFQASK